MVSISGLEPLLTQDGSTPTFNTVANSRVHKSDMRTAVVGADIPNHGCWVIHRDGEIFRG